MTDFWRVQNICVHVFGMQVMTSTSTTLFKADGWNFCFSCVAFEAKNLFRAVYLGGWDAQQSDVKDFRKCMR